MNRKLIYAVIPSVVAATLSNEPVAAECAQPLMEQPALPLPEQPHTEHESPSPEDTRNVPSRIAVSATLTPASGLWEGSIITHNGEILHLRSK